ncbi:MAG: M23 family metallopeptidase [Flavobacteriales bacterium]
MNSWKKFILFTLLYLVCLAIGRAQAPIDSIKGKFHPPMNIPLTLSGNFGELRTNHFHTGIDIKTQGTEGIKVVAVEDGYISRINISHYGYGLALYVDHPNGYTSVYAHLSKFSPEIEAETRKEQFRQQKETITYYPEKGLLPVKKGGFIAYSGNSGSSGGPHLHFEIRETVSEKPINPLLLNFKITDTKPPLINGIKVYPINGSNVNGKHVDQFFVLSGGAGNYKLAEGSAIEVNGEFALGIHTIDMLDAASNKCGVYEIKLFVDNRVIFHQVMDKLDFYTNRYINAHKDYAEFHRNNRSLHRSFLLANNMLPIYEVVENRGVIHFTDNKMHQLRYEVKDSHGNLSTLHFDIKHNSKLATQDVNTAGWLNCNDENVIKGEHFKLFLPAKALYEDVMLPVKHDSMSNRVTIGNENIPFQQYFVLKMKGVNISGEHEEKILLARENSKGSISATYPANIENGWVSGRLRDPGTYKIVIDTVPPRIIPVNIADGKDLSAVKSIIFNVTDNLSGIETYDVFINDEWKLSFFDRKKNTVTLPFDNYNNIGKGSHKLRLEAIDERGNKSVYEATFIR